MELPYTLGDDPAAIETVEAETNRPDPARWPAMTTGDDRLRQTYRPLGQLIKPVEVAFIKHKVHLYARTARLPQPDSSRVGVRQPVRAHRARLGWGCR
ncbi:hypothetical protein [Amycolatopsis sp. RTGN1]|uniref:hypothetical protein n=1 Tax=Amycolatopsis ponsaeliensis TaxID=2992142 RepID=UPI00254B51AB|nr:hypothetical protein [Amycolatopsis sp. RTGN1]